MYLWTFVKRTGYCPKNRGPLYTPTCAITLVIGTSKTHLKKGGPLLLGSSACPDHGPLRLPPDPNYGPQKRYVSCSQNSIKGGYIRGVVGDYYRGYQGGY